MMTTFHTPFRWLVLLLISSLFTAACTSQIETSTSTDSITPNDNASISSTEHESSDEANTTTNQQSSDEANTTTNQPEPTNLPSSTVREIIDNPDAPQPEPTNLPSSTVREIIDDPDTPQPIDDPDVGVGVAGPGGEAQPIDGPMPLPDADFQELLLHFVQPIEPVSLTEANDQLEVCGSVLVPVSYVVTTNEPVLVALEELLARDPVDLDLENYVFDANITIANIAITNRHAMIWLEGDVKRTDPCDDLRIYHQLEETVLGFPYIDSVELFANGELLDREFDLGVGIARPAIEVGVIEGGLSFPAQGIPALDIYAISVADPNVFYQITTEAHQMAFRFEGLVPGDYYLVAYLHMDDNPLIGAYTQAVVCGLTAECTDHTLIPVSDGNTTGIEISDWYAPPGAFPTRPTGTPQPLG